VLTESVKKLRGPLAMALLAAAALYLLATLALLLKEDLGDFTDRAFFLQDEFTNPVWVLVVLAALAMVVSSDRPSPMARTVAIAALALLGLMLLLGVVCWLAGYGAEATVEYLDGVGKVTGTLYALARLLLLAVAAFLAYQLVTSMPAPARQPKRDQQRWGAQPGQQQWGQQGAYGQPGGPYGQPAPQGGAYGQPGQQGAYGQQGQWAAPAAGAGAAGVAGYAAGGEQSSWGQQDPYAAPPASGQSSAGYAAGGAQSAWDQQHGAYAAPAPDSGQSSAGYAAPGERAVWGQPAPDQQQAWGQPGQGQQQAWGQPQPEQPRESWGRPQQDQQWAPPAQPAPDQQGDDEATQTWDRPSDENDPDATVVRDPNAEAEHGAQDEQGRDGAEQSSRDDDDRPGWWAPGS
jgi:hypothetical protein